MLCNTLSKVVRQVVDFDPTNLEHLNAFKMLVLGDNGVIRQHPTLRFAIEQPFDNVRSMMIHRVAQKYLEEQFLKAQAQVQSARPFPQVKVAA